MALFAVRQVGSLQNIFFFVKDHRRTVETLLIGLAALSLRLINLEQWPRWYVDEGTNGTMGVNLLNGLWGHISWGPNFGPPLYSYLLTSAMVRLLGNTYFAIRLPSAIFGSISCVLLYFIGTKLYNRFIGISASLLLVIASATLNRLALYDNLVELLFLLAIFFYLKMREDGKQRWVYMIGVMAGLAVLSKYTGIAVLIFIIFQSLIDRRFFQVWKAIPIFTLIALIYPLIGWIINWGAFLHDTLEFGTRTSYLDHVLYMVMMNNYRSQIAFEGWRFQYDIWSTLGFILLFYLLARNKDGDRLACLWAASILLVYFFYGTGWWIFLLILYPIYSLAISVALHDIVSGRGNYPLLAVAAMLLMLPIFTYQHVYPVSFSQYGKYVFYVTFLFAFAVLLAKHQGFGFPFKIRVWMGSLLRGNQTGVFRALLLAPIVITISAGSFFQLKPIFTTDDSLDQRAVVDWLNANTKQGDLVGASNPISYPLKKATGIPYGDVVFMTTRQNFLNWNEELLPRYNLDCSLWKMDYFVVDTPLKSFGLGSFLSETVKATWIPELKVGDYTVYKNPGYATTPNWLSGGVDKGATPDSKVSVLDGGLKITLASTTPGKTANGWAISAKVSSLPLDITIYHSIPEHDTLNYHSYNFALVGRVDQYFIVQQRGPPGFIQAGVQDGDKWMPLWNQVRPPAVGPIEWRVTLDSNSFTFYENGEKLCQIPNTLPQKEFALSISQDTADTTLKTWEIYGVKSVGKGP